MTERIACTNCRNETPIDQPGASYFRGGYDACGEYNDPLIICAGCLADLDAWLSECNAQAEAEAAANAEIAAASEQWRRRWPMHCTACHGFGGQSFQESHGGPYGSETIFDLCDEGPPARCHRCGMHGLDAEDGRGPCRCCGWDYNDWDPAWAG